MDVLFFSKQTGETRRNQVKIGGSGGQPDSGRRVMKEKCVKCGSERLTPGKLQSSGLVGFRPDKAKFFTSKTADTKVKATICLECGFIEMIGDVEKLNKLVQGP